MASEMCVAGGASLPADGAAEARRQDLHGEETIAHAGGSCHRHCHRSTKFQVSIMAHRVQRNTAEKKQAACVIFGVIDFSTSLGDSVRSADMPVVQYRGKFDDMFQDHVGIFYKTT